MIPEDAGNPWLQTFAYVSFGRQPCKFAPDV